MGGYIAAIILAVPSDALTATATYPVIGAVLARFLLRQQLDRVGWLGVTVAVAGAALVAVDASGSDNSVHALVGVGVALAAAAAVAMEGIVATRAMVGLDTNIVMAVQKSLSAIMFGLVLLVIPGGIATVGSVMAIAGLIVPIACAGVIAAYSYVVWYRSIREIGVARAMALNISYAMWGAVLALDTARCAPDAARACRMCGGDRGRGVDDSLRPRRIDPCHLDIRRSAARLGGGNRTSST